MPPAQKKDPEFRVVCAGLHYRPVGSEVATSFAARGGFIAIDDKEAERLIDLGAIVGKDDPDPVTPDPGNLSNSRELESAAEHAARAKKK